MDDNQNNMPKDQQEGEFNFSSFIKKSEKFQLIKNELQCAIRLSFTGITNLVVNYENPALVDRFLKECFDTETLYNATTNIDAVELQQGSPGSGMSLRYIDALIYGAIIEEQNKDDLMLPKLDKETGKRQRYPSGFVNRKEVLSGKFKDKYLIIRNIDSALDFCISEIGLVSQKSLFIFDNFRDPMLRNRCRLLLVTNKKLILPFKIRVVEFKPVSSFEADWLLSSIISKYKEKYTLTGMEICKDQIVRKISGLTYTEAGDILTYAMSHSEIPKKSGIINMPFVLKMIRERVNKNYMEDGFGLTQLTSRPWEDYICPETSNFTFDVYKILRDFKEIERIKIEIEKNINVEENEKITNAIKTRIPHVIVIYGKGGLGKSAMPIHLAGLLDFDVWDFNINAVHSKWIGEGSRQMRESLKRISSASHLIVRIDEYDRAIGSTGNSSGGMHEAHKQVESEFMNWLQNSQEENLFIKNNIILVLTTNHKDNITGPLLRSGRSDLVIDIDSFDAKSIKEVFVTTARRMKNRGVSVIGHDDLSLQKEINKLDLDNLSEIATLKGFTVRDIETLVIEMISHKYYYDKTLGKEGIDWANENFITILEHSEGSIKDDGTGELILGDRWIFQQKIKENNNPVQQKNIEQLELFENPNAQDIAFLEK